MSINMKDAEVRECYQWRWAAEWREPNPGWEEEGDAFVLTLLGSRLFVSGGNGRWACSAYHPGRHFSCQIGIDNGNDSEVDEFKDSKVARLIGEAAVMRLKEGCYLTKSAFEKFARIPAPLQEKESDRYDVVEADRLDRFAKRGGHEHYHHAPLHQNFASDAAFQAVYSGGFSRKGFK